MQLVGFILIYPILYLISLLPFRVLYLISDVFYLIIYRVFKYRTKVVRENLRLVFPKKSNEDLFEIEKKFYKHLCDLIFEALKSLTISKKELLKRYQFKNIEILKEIDNTNKSTILMCAHHGNWEWIFILQNYFSTKGYGVYKKLNNKYFDKLIKNIRAKHNTHLISTKETITTLLGDARNNEKFIAGFVADQSPQKSREGHWADFMGIEVPTHTGAEAIAKKLNIPVIFFNVDKVKRGYYEVTFEPISYEPKNEEKFYITETYNKIVEKYVRQTPELYLWTHRRWKHRKKH